MAPARIEASSLYVLAARLCRLAPLSLCRVLARLPLFGLPARARLADAAASFPEAARGARINAAGSPCSILDRMHAELPAPDAFEGRRVALLAHHDPHGLVDPYVIRYMKALRELGYAAILVSDRELSLPDDARTWADAVLWRDCPGYDFTSWKGALEFFPSIGRAGELLLANDSVFAPVNPLGPVHAFMDGVACDFWGLTESAVRPLVLQSYYLVFRAPCLAHPAFWDFWRLVDATADRREVIARFELGLTGWLARHGLTPAAYVPARGFPEAGGADPTHLCWRALLRDFGFPCVKRGLLAGDVWWLAVDGWEKELASRGYPVETIRAYLRRVRG